MDDGEALRRAGQRDVEGAQALDLVAHDARRLDDDDAVELEALDDADRHDRDGVVEAGAGGPAVLDAGRGERGGDLLDEAVGGDDGDVARRQVGRHLGHGIGDRRAELGP